MVHTAQGNIILFAVYMPRQCVDSNGTSKLFEEDLAKLTNNRTRFVVAGDLNARHTQWRNHVCNKNGTILADHLSFGTCTIHYPDEPTFLSPAGTTSTIDVFLSDLDLSKPVTHHQLSSDHFPVVCELACSPTPAPVQMRRDYHRVNWVTLSRIVDTNITENPDLATTTSIDNHLTMFEEAIHTAEEACIRWVPVRRQFIAIDPCTRQLIQQRNTIRRQFQRTGCLQKKQQVTDLNRRIADRMASIRNNQFSNAIGQMGDQSKPFWKVAKVLKQKPKPLPPLKDDTGNILVSPQEKVEAIASKLVLAHNIGASMVSPYEAAVQRTIHQLEQRIHDVPPTGRVSEEDVRAAVKRGKNMKAPGNDAIFNLILKKLSSKAYNFLAAILTRCFQLNYFPSRWKTGKVIPILKPGKDPTLPTSYRPITLLSAVSKLFERIILQRLMEHIEQHQVIIPEQFGFRKGHSTVHQLVRVENIIKRNKSLSNNTAMALLDVEKAFDNVLHEGLIHKLMQTNCPVYLIRIIRSYLSKRQFRVHLYGTYSELHDIAAGVPQGSLLGPILFNVFTSDVPQLPSGCSLALYADDSAIMANGRMPKDYRARLQRGVTTYVSYLTSWKIKVNEAKTQTIVFKHRQSPKLSPPTGCHISVNNCPINWSSKVTYLGVTIDEKLLYREHTDKLKQRCIGLLKSLYSLICRRSRLSQRNKLAVFKMIIAPIVNYAMPLWGSCAEIHKRKLQTVQNRLLRTIMNAPFYTRTADLHRVTGCKTIQERIEDSRTTFVEKAISSEHQLIRALVN